MEWIPLEKEEDVASIVSSSNGEDVVAVGIFKHSTRCGVSTSVMSDLERNWAFHSLDLPMYYLDLIQFRSLSNAIEKQFEVVHQSPQVLFIKMGQCIYHKSHYDIKVADIDNFFKS